MAQDTKCQLKILNNKQYSMLKCIPISIFLNVLC